MAKTKTADQAAQKIKSREPARKTPITGERRRYTLDALLGELRNDFNLTREQKAWEQMRPVG